MSALVTYDIAGGMVPAIAAVMNLQTVVRIVLCMPAQIPDAGIEGRKRSLHIVRMQTRAPRLDRVREIRLPTEADHTAELVRPDRVGDAEIRIDLHVPHTGLDRLVDRTQTEALIFELLVHTVDQIVHLSRIRLIAAQLREECILFMSRDELPNCLYKFVCIACCAIPV